jgi:hypothetical protein
MALSIMQFVRKDVRKHTFMLAPLHGKTCKMIEQVYADYQGSTGPMCLWNANMIVCACMCMHATCAHARIHKTGVSNPYSKRW